MSKKITVLNEATFDEAVEEGVTLVDFWAAWCGPCKMQLPILEQIATKTDAVKIAKVNVDDEPKLAGRFHIQSIPTFILFKDGEIFNTLTGLQTEEDLLAAIKESKE